MFYSRINELNSMKEWFKKSNIAIALYGKRRVGKTTLIKQADKGNKTFIYFECLKDTLSVNISLFIEQCKNAGVTFPSYFNSDSFIYVFEYLSSLNKEFVIAIDEYPFLKELNNGNIIDSAFQNIIDNHLHNIDLIISGSEIKMMEEIIAPKNPLFGRFKETIYLDELNYIDVSNFYDNKSSYAKVAFYSVFGGSPYINEFIDKDKSLKENVINTFLKKGSGVYNYADYLLLSDAVNELQAKRILSFLSNGKRKYKDIMDNLDTNKTGLLNRSLMSLLDLKLINKNEPINKIGDSKKSTYEIHDNVLRFFYTFIYKNQNQLELLGASTFYDKYIEPTIVNYISYRFEEQCRQYFSIMSKQGKYQDIMAIGTYYYDDKNSHTNGEFDVAIKTMNGFDIYEVKYLRNPLDLQTMKQEEKQIRNIKGIDINNIGFISISGFKDKTSDYIYIDGEELYK